MVAIRRMRCNTAKRGELHEIWSEDQQLETQKQTATHDVRQEGHTTFYQGGLQCPEVDTMKTVETGEDIQELGAHTRVGRTRWRGGRIHPQEEYIQKETDKRGIYKREVYKGEIHKQEKDTKARNKHTEEGVDKRRIYQRS
jgi:hypothetical protein